MGKTKNPVPKDTKTIKDILPETEQKKPQGAKKLEPVKREKPKPKQEKTKAFSSKEPEPHARPAAPKKLNQSQSQASTLSPTLKRGNRST